MQACHNIEDYFQYFSVVGITFIYIWTLQYDRQMASHLNEQ